jgi:eukaryotic-like serine/threonine-protein kinase
VETSTDVSAEVIRAQLDRILASPGFVHSDRMVRFLRFTVEQTIQGHADSLKESVLGMEVFDRTSSFDPRTDTIVRVEARRLRSKLKEYYETRGQHDAVLIEFPKGSYVPTFLKSNGLGGGKLPAQSQAGIHDGAESGSPPPTATSTSSSRLQKFGIAMALGLGLVGITLGLTLWLTRGPRSAHPPKLTRLTSDLGLTYEPALSRDGKLLAYASDRSGEGNLDIWVKQISGGEAVRLTHDAADDHEPSFSPDGSKIVFRSERDGGGIYFIPALGGEERLVARQGRRPQISPDGRTLAYFTLNLSSGIGVRGPASIAQLAWLADGRDAKIYVVALEGGQPRELQPEFAWAESPIWSPDGRHLLFLGSEERPTLPIWSKSRRNTFDWWVTPLDGGKPVSTGAAGRFRRQGFHGPNCRPGSWMSKGTNHAITFSILSENTSSLWQVGISAKTWQVDDLPDQLTSGTGLEVDPSFEVNRRLVFASLVSNSDIWSLPIAANRGKALGELRAVVQSAAADVNPSLSNDGQKLAFNSTRSGHSEVYIKDMKTGEEKALTENPLKKGRVLLSPDGSKVAFVAFDGEKANVYSLASTGGPVQKLCEGCGYLLNWSPSGRELLHYWGQPIRFGLLDVLSGARRTVLQHPTYELLRGIVSPDERWIAFHVPLAQNRSSVFVAPLRQVPAPESDWIRVTEGSGMDNWPFWSPDGRLLYFLSHRDGFRCVWAQPLDFETKHPVGSPNSVLHIHGARRSLSNWRSSGEMGMSLTPDALVFSLLDITGNIWMAEMEQ